jgi:hypothetical protein
MLSQWPVATKRRPPKIPENETIVSHSVPHFFGLASMDLIGQTDYSVWVVFTKYLVLIIIGGHRSLKI